MILSVLFFSCREKENSRERYKLGTIYGQYEPDVITVIDTETGAVYILDVGRVDSKGKIRKITLEDGTSQVIK